MGVKCQKDPASHTQQQYPVGTGPQSHEEHNNYNNSSMLIHCSCSNSAVVAPNARPVEVRLAIEYSGVNTAPGQGTKFSSS